MSSLRWLALSLMTGLAAAQEFYCGTKGLESLAQREVMEKCPYRVAYINECCRRHDHCYEVQLGQAFCDDRFCACLSAATECRWGGCRRISDEFCWAVKSFGGGAYLLSGMNRNLQIGMQRWTLPQTPQAQCCYGWGKK
ncbi:Protein Y52B11A.8 [Aphelenchoides avenae]|nr:Protein Y52B11A.8 [Aphelenchus avenae]